HHVYAHQPIHLGKDALHAPTPRLVRLSVERRAEVVGARAQLHDFQPPDPVGKVGPPALAEAKVQLLSEVGKNVVKPDRAHPLLRSDGAQLPPLHAAACRHGTLSRRRSIRRRLSGEGASASALRSAGAACSSTSSSRRAASSRTSKRSLSSSPIHRATLPGGGA